MKTCYECRKSKYPESFNRDADCVDGLVNICKECQDARERDQRLTTGRIDELLRNWKTPFELANETE